MNYIYIILSSLFCYDSISKNNYFIHLQYICLILQCLSMLQYLPYQITEVNTPQRDAESIVYTTLARSIPNKTAFLRW